MSAIAVGLVTLFRAITNPLRCWNKQQGSSFVPKGSAEAAFVGLGLAVVLFL